MSDQLRLERQLPDILEGLYLGGTPDYRDEVLAAVARTRQRPAWTLPERWLPMVDIAARPAFLPRVPVRMLFLLIALLLALAVGIAAWVGSNPALPAPFGPARNGLLVYSVDGDLFTATTATAQPRPLVSSPLFERQPIVSPDGRKVAFFRGEPQGAEDAFSLVVINIDGTGERVLEPSGVGDADAIVWAPDGTFLLRNVGDFEIVRYDLDGRERQTIATAAILRADAFQPPTGAKVLYESSMDGPGLWVMNPDGSGAAKLYTVPLADMDRGCDFNTSRWSPDGTRIAFLRKLPGAPEGCRIYVMNADGSDAHPLTTATGIWVESDLRWSPDGTSIAFNRWEKHEPTNQWFIRPIGVVSANGGEVRGVGPTPVPAGAAFSWSPDGRTIVSLDGSTVGWAPMDLVSAARPIIIDVATGVSTEATWSASSWLSWQRLAP